MNKILKILIILLALNQNILAQEFSKEIKQEGKEISELVMSPFCPGRSLNDCPSKSASELKNKILLKISQGKSRKQILNSLFQEYGDEISAMPQNRGIGRLAWLFPLLFFLIGGIAIFIFLNKKPKNS